jgi:hypothetical protein
MYTSQNNNLGNLYGFSLLFILFLLANTPIFGQSTGPTQPEVQSFQSVEMTNMVEPATGEFQYSIPLFEIGGYPINMNYNSQVGMEQEASCIGLGFNTTPGFIIRNVRGLPDDFKGDKIRKKINLKDNITKGVDLGVSLEVFGFKNRERRDTSNHHQIGVKLSSSAGLFYNNYTGWGIESNVGLGFHGNFGGLNGNAGIGINSNSQHGTNVTPYAGLSFSLNYLMRNEKTNWKENYVTSNGEGKKIKCPELSIGSSLDFGKRSYTPQLEFPFTTISMDFSAKATIAGAYVSGGGEIKGYITKQKLSRNDISTPAYGFLYAESGKDISEAMMDFNRENDGVMTEAKPFLPLLYGTQDIYTIAGHGIGGSFELKRNNVFVGFDPLVSTNSHAGGGELEFGFGIGNHIGAEIRYGYTKNTSQKWNNLNGNNILNLLDFKEPTDLLSEQCYFKNPSDVMFNSNPVFKFFGFEPIAPKLNRSLLNGGGTYSDYLLKKHSFIQHSDPIVNSNRDNRLDVIYYQTAKEAKLFGIQRTIDNYSLNDFAAAPEEVLRQDESKGRNPDHISEIICLKPDGKRYVFNVPAYNNKKSEYSFTVHENMVSNNITNDFPRSIDGISTWSAGKDDYASVTETPAYVHTFFIGSILATNYVDVDDNGPSVNDIGDYVKFNYSRIDSNYYWRSNNDVNLAMADLGNKADKKDARGFYTEGEKEIWYVHSIESKNEVARYFYSPRDDAYNLKDRSKKLQKLDSILVYTRQELNKINPIPFKKIYFNYNKPNQGENLCRGINGDQGNYKLTLNSVYFKDGNSNKGKHSSYQFDYSDFNPNYDANAFDVWGNYKGINANNTMNIADDNKDFPYVVQNNKTQADINASAWLLNKITLPSGGSIKIDYEAHDYAFVQHHKAMAMTKVVDIWERMDPQATLSSDPSNLNNKELYNGNTSNNYLIFKLKNPITASSIADAHKKVKEQYFTDLIDNEYGQIVNNAHNNLYGKFSVKLYEEFNFGEEDIPVFLDVDSVGAIKDQGNTYSFGYVKLKDKEIGSSNNYINGNGRVNQISYFSWQFICNNYPQILFGMDNDNASLSADETIQAMANMFNPVMNIAKSLLNTGPYRELKKKRAGSIVNLDKSFIRLYVPDGFKYGGAGARVKKITIDDNWQNMAESLAKSASYSIAYDYRKVLNGDTISSGVASYEPNTKYSENPWKQPVLFSNKNILMPDDNNYIMHPVGESLFPSANIVYSEVKTTQNPINDTKLQGTGYTINEFYTCYDFPTRISNTDIQTERDGKFNFSLLKNISHDFMLSSQGFAVVTNDMHGKPKSESVYGEAKNLISSKYYKYKTNSNHELSNEVKAIAKNGQINSSTLGIETQTYGDARSFYSQTVSGSVHANIMFATNFSIVPPPAVSIIPDINMEQKNFNSMTLTKHIRQQGILDSVILIDKGSRIYTKNELWDAKTGAVLLTSTINEFKQPIYNFTYPAHWVYNGMGMASDNIGTVLKVDNQTPFPNPNFEFQSGDIVGISDATYSNGYKALIAKNANNNTYTPIPFSNFTNFNPSLTSTSGYCKVLQSGKKNLATTPVGSFTSLVNPVQNDQLIINNSTKILDASAAEFTNHASVICLNCNSIDTIQRIRRIYYNLFASPWQPLASYKFLESRSQSKTDLDLKNEGFVNNFVPFWDANNWTKSSSNKWKYTEYVSLIDDKFNPIESTNALNISSSSQLSNFKGLINATSSNAKYHENMFESFEDVTDQCEKLHFGILETRNVYLDNLDAHTGKYSIKIGTIPLTLNYLTDSLLKCKKVPFLKDGCKPYRCPPEFTLLPNKKYIISVWTKEANAPLTALNYSNANVKVLLGNSDGVVCKPTGPIIDGWQRIEQEFTTPSSYENLTLQFSPNANFDDIRIFPADANMKSYVYNDQDYSLMATLDENNYATFYEYDGEKKLKRVKKETEKGVVTVQEVNFGSFKK